jgi:hypothetical protein
VIKLAMLEKTAWMPAKAVTTNKKLKTTIKLCLAYQFLRSSSSLV